MVATAALEEGVITPERQIYCPGGGTFYGRFFKCHLAGGHGNVDLRHAIEKSCNTYFYTVGNMLGVDKMHKWAEKLGLARQERHRPAERSREHRAVDRVEAEALQRALVSGRNDLGGDRPGPAVGDADVDGGDDGDASPTAARASCRGW